MQIGMPRMAAQEHDPVWSASTAHEDCQHRLPIVRLRGFHDRFTCGAGSKDIVYSGDAAEDKAEFAGFVSD
jgi:hypothetical protein